MRSLIFTGLLALQIVLSTCDEPKLIDISEGGRIDLETPNYPGKLVNCTLETSANKVYSIYPEKELHGEFNEYSGTCNYLFRDTDLSYAGLWTMTTITDEGEHTDKFAIRIKRTIKTVPSDRISAFEGQWIYIALDTNETDVRSCNITTPPYFTKYNLMTDTVEGLSLWGKCGIQMFASKSVQGQWEIHSQVGEYLINYAIFHIDIPWQREGETVEVIERTWVLGAKDESVDLIDRTALFCELEKPDGTKMPLKYGSCEMKVPVVSSHHEGTWRASYATVGKIELEHKEIVIKTKDLSFLECSYSAGVGEEINLLCRSGESSLKFCTFIRPDKHTIHLPAGVGNENYTYYGKGFGNTYSDNREYSECGVTIRKPAAVDFGLWTCEMGTANGITGSVITVPTTRAGEMDRESRIQNPTVYVKRGDPFKIDCKGSSKLTYCWVSSPNGTAFSVSDEGSSGKSFKYDGKGFAMGECGAIIPTSNSTDSGVWTCHLGYGGGFEVEQTVPVKVTDSYLIPGNDMVHVAKSTKLTCRTFIGEDGSVKYCRWVRPNGHGINMLDASRYRLNQEIDRCELTILDFQSEDVGKWTCFASLTRFTDREEWATIELKSEVNDQAQMSSVLMIILGSGLLIFTLVGASYAAFVVFRKRNSRVIKDPPPYYPADYTIPDEIRTGGDPIPNKSDRF